MRKHRMTKDELNKLNRLIELNILTKDEYNDLKWYFNY